jgi:type IV secretory pathway VirJ component
MTRTKLASGSMLLLLAILTVSAWVADRLGPVHTRTASVDDPLLGRPHVLAAVGETRAVTMLFSGPDGWDKAAEALAGRLAAEGIMVIGIDLKAALPLLAASSDECVAPHWGVQHLSHELQRALALPRYHLPLLAGIGPGGDLAVHIADTASPAVIGGAISVNSTPMPALPHSLCDDVPGGHGVPVTRLAGDEADDRLLAALSAGAQAPAAEDTTLADLPLTELPAKATHGVLAIVYSGDGGWRDLDKDIAEYLAAHGVPTVGLDMLRYYWAWKSPMDSAADLSRLIRHYRSVWGINRVLLVGYSFGADVLPALFNLLPPADRNSVAQISLLALSANANFEVSVGEWLTDKSASTQPTRADIDRINPSLLQCFSGADDKDAICEQLARDGIEVVTTSGGHHFDGDYDSLSQRIINGLPRRLNP